VTITGHDFSGATAVSFGGTPAQTFTVNSDTSITATAPAGSAGAVDVRVTTAGGQSPVSAADRFTYVAASSSATAAVVSNASQTHRVWSEPQHPKLAQISAKRPPIGTTFRFTLNKAASAHLVFKQLLPGRKVNGRCVAPTARDKLNPRCTRRVVRGKLGFSGHAGVNTVRFFGWLSKSRKLKPGNYMVVITAITPGVGSSSKALRFTIVT
jgi:hypothetical protein